MLFINADIFTSFDLLNLRKKNIHMHQLSKIKEQALSDKQLPVFTIFQYNIGLLIRYNDSNKKHKHIETLIVYFQYA